MMNKKAVAVIAVIALIGIAVAASVIVYSFVIPIIKENLQKAQSEVEGPLPAPVPGAITIKSLNVYPDKGQIGTVFKFSIELVSEEQIYSVNAEISRLGEAIKIIPLYDDGSHGDGRADDGNYANVWDSAGENEGIYDVKITINSAGTPAEQKKTGAFSIFRENCAPLIFNGNPDDKIDITFVPYGYSNLDKFRQDALTAITKGLFTYEPFASNQNKFNFYIVNQTGDFNCKRDESIKSLIRCNDSEVTAFASQCPSDQVIVLLDYGDFCGSASSYVMACNGEPFEQVVVHEIGHALGGLGDEYDYSADYPSYVLLASNFPNCDIQGCNKWAGFNAGCFKGCGISNLYRPTESDCIMNRYVNIFCPVCRKHIEELLSNYVAKPQQIMPAPAYEKTYLIDFSYDSGKLNIKDIYVTKSRAPDRKISRTADYIAKLFSFDKKEVYSFNFSAPRVLFPPPPLNSNETGPPAIILDKVEWTILAPQFDNASTLEIYDKEQKKVLSADVGYLSNSCGDGICEAHESAIECPSDCRADAKDGICNYMKDDVCDPDCPPGADPDCKRLSPLLSAALIVISIVAVIIVIILILRSTVFKTYE
jgi:hypothetical protein